MSKIKNMSPKEKAVVKRGQAMEYPTDRLGPASLMVQQSHTNGSRMVLVNHQYAHHVDIKDPEAPLVPTGFENVLGSYSSMLDQVDADYEIVAKFVKNDYNYVLVGYDKKHRRYHAWKRVEIEEHSEGFSTKYNNNYIDKLSIGDVVKKGTYIVKSDNFDKYGNYQYGKNVNVVYITSPMVYEDGIVVMNNADKMFNVYKAHTFEINLADNEFLLNLYGDEKHYQGLPLVGQKVKDGIAAAVRRSDNSKAPFSLKKKRLRQILRSDRPYYVDGRVIDIEIHTNKDPRKMSTAGVNELINILYQEQQDYYRELYDYMRNIVDGATDGEYTYTDEFTIICEEAHDYVDSSAFFADTSDKVYGNTKIILHVLDEEKLMAGSKMVGRSGNKGVISCILPPEKSWKMEDGTPIHFVVAALGVVGRLNQSQLNEHSVNELSATAVRAMKETDDLNQKGAIVYKLLTYLNKDEAAAWKKWYKDLSKDEKKKCCKKIEKRGCITVVQEPIDNCNILDLAAAYEEFPPNYQHILYPSSKKGPDGKTLYTMSLKKVLCAKMFYMRLMQDPLEKYSSRSRGPVNPLTTLPAKSNMKKKFLAPYSDVAVRFGEMELEILTAMVNHPAAVASFMMENSTSYEAKLAVSEQAYLSDPEDDIDTEDVIVKGKKNIEWIGAYLGVLGSSIKIETEVAPPGEYFED